MKTETKSKIKKALKVGAYVGGLMLALVLGMGFGSCSEKKMQDQASQRAQPKHLMPKLAEEGFNLLNLAEEYRTIVNVHWTSDVDSGNDVGPGTGWVTYVFDYSVLTEGHTYVITHDGNSWPSSMSPNTNIDRCLGGVANSVYQKIANKQSFLDYDDSLVKWVNPVGSSYSSPICFSIPSNFYVHAGGGSSILKFSISCPPNVTGVFLADDATWLNSLPSVEEISFSETSWFPYQLLGQNNSPVIAGPYNGGTMDTIEKGITDLLFSSNGRLFKGILFTFAPLAQVGSTASQQRNPSTYGYYNQDMTPIDTPQECHSDYLWYLSQVDYIPVEGGPFVYVGGQRMKQFSDSSQSVTQFFDWVDKRFSDISIKWAGTKVNTEITTTSGLTNLQWLENIALSVFDNTISLGGGSVDVFSLIGNGFSSITSILNVQILPYLTLGTLLLAPLVILLALAILKVLNK